MEKMAVSVAGYLTGYVVSWLVYGREEGAVGWIPNMRFSVWGWDVSPHHWMYFLGLAVVVLYLQAKYGLFAERIYYFILGVGLGGLHQGLSYKDWYMVVK